MDDNIVSKVFLYNALMRSVAFVCITIAAVCFKSTSILWWYLVPALTGLSASKD